MSRLPVIPTVVVAAAVATMIALGFWQLARKGEKEAMIARYADAVELSGKIPFPRTADEIPQALYRKSEIVCDEITARRTTAGTGPNGEQGLAQIVTCDLEGGGTSEVALGLSRSPEPIAWRGGEVRGYVSNAGEGAVRLVASPPVADLEPMARPDPRDLPNNHLAYAVQWFLFALTAVVIYWLALRRR
ncbi:SURF1 family protein [Erythrobacter litoralis]|uniref:SURF1 family cytochrome oxidase biogenesis protein n=1 Tax=Erythrobacter litoralis TaxID=39960 RepID=UPI002434ED4A|nr:SURF1 family cytochrome oxidase biogenesis protein [Erythrobacter litoralis]MDG6080324.1 SURF1 family protein [Erythrobacter litoralis]